MQEGETRQGLKRPLSVSKCAEAAADRFKHVLLLSENDGLVQAVKLEGNYIDRSRYLCIVSHDATYCILGVDECNELEDVEDNLAQEADDKAATTSPTIGLVVQIAWGMRVTLDGDGGISYRHGDKHFTFKPVSVQALWTVIQTLNMIAERLSPQMAQEGWDWVRTLKILTHMVPQSLQVTKLLFLFSHSLKLALQLAVNGLHLQPCSRTIFKLCVFQSLFSAFSDQGLQSHVTPVLH